jgi:hypothetical protein
MVGIGYLSDKYHDKIYGIKPGENDLKKYYKTYKHFDIDYILGDLVEFEEQINSMFHYSDDSVWFEIYKKGEETNYELYEIAMGDWLVKHGAEYGESVYVE